MKPNESMIRSLVVDMLTKDNKWVKMPIMPAARYDLYVGQDVTKLKLAKVSTFDAFIGQRNLRSHETARGWLLLDYLPTQDPENLIPTFKVGVEDFEGDAYHSQALQALSGVGYLETITIYCPEQQLI